MFPQLLSATLDAGRPAVKAAFITDSIALGELEDASAYQFEAPLKQKKRASTSTVATPRPKRKGSSLVKTEQVDTTPLLRPQIGIRSAAKKRKTSMSTATTTPSPARTTPSPTPPPESSRLEMAPGIYRYTEDEQAFMFRYFEYLLQFDGSTTTALTAKRLHERVCPFPLVSKAKAKMSFRCLIIPSRHGRNTYVPIVLISKPYGSASESQSAKRINLSTASTSHILYLILRLPCRIPRLPTIPTWIISAHSSLRVTVIICPMTWSGAHWTNWYVVLLSRLWQAHQLPCSTNARRSFHGQFLMTVITKLFSRGSKR